ncbi:MAG: hypothetical protein FK731_10665 [Asgard group archaeon]|nr:hypothetical protein [Asgard group archaeon]
MTLDTNDLLIKLLLALAFVLVIGVFIIVLTILGKAFKGKEKKPIKNEVGMVTKKITTTGKHLNELYQYSVFFLIFSILCIFLLLSFSLFQNDLKLTDIWPFILLIIILILYSLSLIDRQKIRSKRTIQRDMREI